MHFMTDNDCFFKLILKRRKKWYEANKQNGKIKFYFIWQLNN